MRQQLSKNEFRRIASAATPGLAQALIIPNVLRGRVRCSASAGEVVEGSVACATCTGCAVAYSAARGASPFGQVPEVFIPLTD